MWGTFYWMDLDEYWYQGVIWVAEYEFEVKIWNFVMADPIWRIKIWKNLMNWRISMRVGTKGFSGSLKTYIIRSEGVKWNKTRKLSIVEKNASNKKCVSRWGLQVIFETFCEIFHIGWDKHKQPWFLWFFYGYTMKIK